MIDQHEMQVIYRTATDASGHAVTPGGWKYSLSDAQDLVETGVPLAVAVDFCALSYAQCHEERAKWFRGSAYAYNAYYLVESDSGTEIVLVEDIEDGLAVASDGRKFSLVSNSDGSGGWIIVGWNMWDRASDVSITESVPVDGTEYCKDWRLGAAA